MMSKQHANPIQAGLRPIGAISRPKASIKVTNAALLVHGWPKPGASAAGMHRDRALGGRDAGFRQSGRHLDYRHQGKTALLRREQQQALARERASLHLKCESAFARAAPLSRSGKATAEGDSSIGIRGAPNARRHAGGSPLGRKAGRQRAARMAYQP